MMIQVVDLVVLTNLTFNYSGTPLVADSIEVLQACCLFRWTGLFCRYLTLPYYMIIDVVYASSCVVYLFPYI